MPLFFFLIILTAIVIIGAVNGARHGRLNWANSNGINLLLLLLSLASLGITVYILATVARFESDTNITVAGAALNIPLMLAPLLLFIIAMVLLVRFIKGLQPVRGDDYDTGRL